MKISHNKPTKALVDGDILVYRVGFSCQRKGEDLLPEPIARARLNEAITKMMDAVECSEFEVFLTSTDKSNFRYTLDASYKANRVIPKPEHYEFLRKVLRDDFSAQIIEGEEADDAMGRYSIKDETVICTIDKDLDQIPGWHYNFVKEVLYYIEPLEAARWFYSQVLIGDVSDNVKGCPGIGSVKADRMLEGCRTEREMLETVVGAWQNKVKSNWSERLLLAGKLLWLRKPQKPVWVLPSGEVVSKDVLENCLKRPELDSSSSLT